MSNVEQQQEALERAQHGQALTNYPAIYQGFLAKGIPETEILPRVNVFSFNAWRALGRTVKRGEHGVRVCTFVDMSKEEEGEERKTWRAARSVTVFHISQTAELGERDRPAGTPEKPAARPVSTESQGFKVEGFINSRPAAGADRWLEE